MFTDDRSLCLSEDTRSEKILLCAGNSIINSPLVLITLGTIYLFLPLLPLISWERSLPAFPFAQMKWLVAKGCCNMQCSLAKMPKSERGATILRPRGQELPLFKGGAEAKEGQSAGNFGFSTEAPAVTKNTYTNYKKLPHISEHVPKHKSNLTDEEFGYFLAGLIEGDGWFGKKELHIILAEEDTSLAYYIKKRIGHGNVYKMKDKKAVRYICKNTNGLSLILSLVNGKLVSNYKYDQLIKHNYSEQFNIVILPPLKALSLDNS